MKNTESEDRLDTVQYPYTVKPVLSGHSKRTPKIGGFPLKILLDAFCITFIKLPFVVKTFVLSILSGRLRQVYCNNPMNSGNALKFDRTCLDLNGLTLER